MVTVRVTGSHTDGNSDGDRESHWMVTMMVTGSHTEGDSVALGIVNNLPLPPIIVNNLPLPRQNLSEDKDV